MTVTEYIRKRLLDSVGVADIKTQTELSPTEILEQEMDWEFLAEMAHGMIMGYFRYGKASDSTLNYLDGMKRKIALYEETGNLECLRDIANFAMQERKKPSIEAHYKAVDDGEHLSSKG